MHFTKKMKKSIDDYISGKYLYLVNISFTDLDLYDIAEINNIVNKAYYYLRSNVHSVFCKNTNGMIKKYYINERPDKTFEVGLKIIAAANKEYIPEKIKTSIFLSLIRNLGISESAAFAENNFFSVQLNKINQETLYQILLEKPVSVEEENLGKIKEIMWLKKVVTFSGDFRKLKLKYNRNKRNPSREG